MMHKKKMKGLEIKSDHWEDLDAELSEWRNTQTKTTNVRRV